MKTLYIFALLLLFPTLSYSQKEYKSGVIYFNNQDSIKTQILYGGDAEMSQSCRYKADEDEFSYKPSEIEAYKFDKGRYFISKEIKGEKVFLEYLIKGEVDLFYIRKPKKDIYYIQKKGGKLIKLEYESRIRDILDECDQVTKTVMYNSTRHIGLLRSIMSDEPSLQSDIDRIKTPTHRDLIDIAKSYHKLKCNGQECIVYYKKTPSVKMSIEASVSSLYFQDFEEIKPSIGFGVNFWMPKQNENLYFYLGYENMLIDGATYKNNGRTMENMDFVKIDLKYQNNINDFDYNFKIGLCFNYGVSMFYNLATGISYSIYDNLKLNLGAISYLSFGGDATIIPNHLLAIGGQFGLSWSF
jgi:hypothetical protein